MIMKNFRFLILKNGRSSCEVVGDNIRYTFLLVILHFLSLLSAWKTDRHPKFGFQLVIISCTEVRAPLFVNFEDCPNYCPN